MRAPSTRTTRIGVPCAMNSPSVRTSTRRPSIEAMPAGRRKLTAVPVRPRRFAVIGARDVVRPLRGAKREPMRPRVLRHCANGQRESDHGQHDRRRDRFDPDEEERHAEGQQHRHQERDGAENSRKP